FSHFHCTDRDFVLQLLRRSGHCGALQITCQENGMVKIFTDDRAKGIAAYNKLNSKEVPHWVVERMINDHTKHGDEWILQCFFVLATNSLLFPM
ncbi:hypothetical protein ACJX0J_021677, partial [Zea mays]